MNELIMYQIRPDILESLICKECLCYVSCGPVKLKTGGDLVCGRCVLPDNTYIIDSPYENLAKMILFPCRYNKEGCKKEDAFNTIRKHEENCSFKPDLCPVITDGSCQWKNSQKDILKHVKEEHIDNLLEHPCGVPHIFTNSNIKTFVTSIHDFTFLLHVKVCLISGKMYHCVRLVGDNRCASYFEYTLSIESSKSKLLKSKVVCPYNSFETDENNSVVTSITGLEEILGELNNIKFVISIKKLFDIIRCSNCQKIITKFIYKSDNGYKCEKCLPRLKKCKNCDFKDFEAKLSKHMKYFCKNKKACSKILPTIDTKNPLSIISASNATPESVSHKYPKFFHESGKFWTTRIENFPNKFSNVGTKVIHAVKHDFGYVLCEFFKFKQVLDSNVVAYFSIYASLASEELNFYDCHLSISRPDKNFKFETFLEREYEFEADWTIKIDYFHYYDSCHDLDMKITFFPKDIYTHPNAVQNKDNK